MRKALRYWPWLAAIFSGLLCTFCFPPFNQAWLCWFALTPLLAAVWFSGTDSKRRWLRELNLGYLAGLVFFWSAFSWLRTVTVSGWILVGFYMAVYFAVWAWLAGLLRPRTPSPTVPRSKHAWPPPPPNDSPLARSPWLNSVHNLAIAFILACGWVTTEWFRSWVFSGWGWNGLGVALHRILPAIQIAEFTGVAGISFLIVFANVIALTTVRRFILETQMRSMRPHYDLTLTMAAVVGIFAYGILALQVHPPTKLLRIAAIQPNIPREEKFGRPYVQRIFAQFEHLTDLALTAKPPPDLILWPESSMPGPVLIDEENYQFVMKIAAAANTDLLLGSIDQDKEGAYNAALLVSEKGERVQLYRKLHLVPFGEYVPGRHTVPFIARIVGDQVPGDFAVGTDHTVFRLSKDQAQVAPLICFEDTIGELTRQFVLRGANLLANVTNDGWFLRSAGSQQHLANAIFRCIETRRPMVRAANTGVTCFVNQYGRITQELRDETGSQFTEGVLSGEIAVPTLRDLTFYARHGELFAACCAGVTVIALFFNLLRRHKWKQDRV